MPGIRLRERLAIALITSLAACSHADKATGPSQGPKGPSGDTVRAVIGPSGGVMAGKAGTLLSGVRLEIPAGAFSSSVTIQLTADSSVAFPSALSSNPIRATPVGVVVSIDAATDTLLVPGTLTLPFDPHRLPLGEVAGDLVVVTQSPAGAIEVLRGGIDEEAPQVTVDPAAHTLSVLTFHFSKATVASTTAAKARAHGQQNVGCVNGPGLRAWIIDDQGMLGLRPRATGPSEIVVHSTLSPAVQLINGVITSGEDGKAQAHYYIDRDLDTIVIARTDTVVAPNAHVTLHARLFAASYRLVGEGYVANHVRYQSADDRPYNPTAVGIELLQHYHNGAVLDPEPFTEAQYETVRELVRGLRERYPDAPVWYHKYIRPNKKADPVQFDEARLNADALGKCTPDGRDDYATSELVRWSSSDETTAKVDAATGVVTAIAPGKAIITAASAGKRDTLTIKVSGRTLVNRTFAAAQGAVANLVVSCPAGMVVTGGGHDGWVSNDADRPTDDGRGWLIRNDLLSTTGDSPITVFAVCETTPPDGSYQIVKAAYPSPVGTRSNFIAPCPAGMIVTGGGHDGWTRNDATRPTADNSGWLITDDLTNTSSDAVVTVYAVCTKAPAGAQMQVATASYSATAGAVATLASACPRGTLVAAGGHDGWVSGDASSPNAALDAWLVRNNLTSTTSDALITVFAICWKDP